MIERITKAQLNTLTAKHNNNMNLPILTNAVFVTREHDAYKICFIRHDSPPLDTRISPAGNNLTQLSLIFVPMKDTNQATWESTEADENGMISTLSFCVPGRPDNNTTGHCPPASGCNT